MMIVLLIVLAISLGININQYFINTGLKSNSEMCKIDCDLRKEKLRSLESQLEECNQKRLDDFQPEGNLEVEKPKRKPRRKTTK